MKFKVGDKVKVIQKNNSQYGKIGIIKDVLSEICIYEVNFKYHDIHYYESDLILVASSQNVTNKIKGSSIYLDKITLPTTIREEDIVVKNNSKCSHNWKIYHGFTESYEYCNLCDEKRGIK